MSKDTIKQLDTREQCRQKISIWFGSRDQYTHPIKEILANSLDEINNNFDGGEITVWLQDDLKTIAVKDTGRGIPIANKTDGILNYVLLFETLFAGSNYSNNEYGKVTVGTNGCGSCVINHTSELFEVASARDGYLHEVRYENGGKLVHFKKISESDDHFTIVRFRLDDEVYTNTIYNPNEIREICKWNAAVNNKVTIKFYYQDEISEYHYDSTEDYFDEVTANNTSPKLVGLKKSFDNQVEKNAIEVVIATSSEPVQQTFLNSNYLPEHGSIYDGIINGTRSFINKYCKDNNLLDKKIGNISNGDIEESLSFIASIESTNVEFSNQTKFSTNKKLYKDITQSYIQEMLTVMLAENPKGFEKIVKHILEVQKFNSKAQANKKALKKKLSEKIDSISNRVEGLVDCKHHGEDSELYIAEGKSALGSIVLARNPQNQAVIPIRGKILNCLKANYDTIFKSEIITDLVKAIGCGIETDKKNKDLGTFDIKNLRYGKIVIGSDQDADGFNIQCLLLTMIYRLMPTLIKEGRVYIMNTPLYEVRLKDDNNLYWFSETEKEEYITKHGDSEIKHIARSKGLGQVSTEIMAEVGLNPKTRNLTQVTIGDVKKMQKAFKIWMDAEVLMRKEIIETELDKCKDLD